MDERPSFLSDHVSTHSSDVTALVFDAFAGEWLSFSNPVQVYATSRHDSILDILAAIEHHVESGYYAVGFLSYEAAPAFDAALVVKPNSDFPYCFFAIFEHAAVIQLDELDFSDFSLDKIQPSISKNHFVENIEKIKTFIARGDTYQVNYTHRLFADFYGDPLGLFMAMLRNQPTRFAAYLTWRDYAVCSVSPELFFKVDGRQVVCRPMKGTRPRGRFIEEDDSLKKDLKHSTKDRAENVMIVDMIRNDLGRIAETGTVRVDKLFEIEKYPTVWQMTSSISACSAANLTTLLTALFPCASITGAPKVSTMRIIDILETTPRKLYTGTIGLLKPNRHMVFNVAIRTALVNRIQNTIEYGVGSGVVWDSSAEEEWRECRSKSTILRSSPPEFELLETLLYEPDGGIFLLEYHLHRLKRSAAFFDFPFVAESLIQLLQTVKSSERQKLRVLLDKTGDITLEHYFLPRSVHENPVRLKLADRPVDAAHIFLFHKTTFRKVYNEARKAHPTADDVILYNEKNELTETTVCNILLRFGAVYYTPPVSCGLLAGTYRAWLLERGEIEEKILRLEDLRTCDEIVVINSVHGKRKAILVSD